MSPSGSRAARWIAPRVRFRAPALSLVFLLATLPALAGSPGVGAPPARPQFMILTFAVAQAGGVPHSARFKGVLSREVPREIGRRMAGLLASDTRFFAFRTIASGRPRFVVPQHLSSGAEALRIGREGHATFLLDGVLSVTHKLKVRVRLYEVESGRPLWQSVYEKPTAEAGSLLAQAAHDLALAFPDALGEAARSAPRPQHEPGWEALVAYLRGEDMRFLQESHVMAVDPRPILDAFLESIQRDPAYDPPRDALLEETYAEIRHGTSLVEVPLGALARLAALRPEAASFAALAKGQALAGREGAAYASWQKSVAADPAFIEGWLNVARARIEGGEYLEAAAALEKAVAIGLPTARLSARTKRDLGGAYLEAGKLDKAIAALEASVEENPRDPEAFDRLGNACDRKAKSDPGASEAWANRALEAFRTSTRLRGLPDRPLTPPGKKRIY